MPTNVLLVDNSQLVLTGIQRILARHPDINVVGAVLTLEEGIRAAGVFRPDVTVFDLSMTDRGQPSREQTQTLVEASKSVLCISLLAADDISPLLDLIGRPRCVDKTKLSEDLVDSIRIAEQEELPK